MHTKLFFLIILHLNNFELIKTKTSRKFSNVVIVSSEFHSHIQRCLGSIIRKDFVLTSAHCVRSDDGKKFNATIWAGDIFNIQTELEIGDFFSQQVEEIITHGSYIQTPHVHDIALLRMNPALPVASISPILLPVIIRDQILEILL